MSSKADRTEQLSASSVDTSNLYTQLDAYVEQHRRRLNIPGIALAVVEGAQIVHLRGFGQARPRGEPPSPQTPFFIGSLTKSFTALAVLQLVEAGKLELDVPVQHYLPWFRLADPQAAGQISVRQLLNQTSGLSTLAGEMALADFDARADATERQARALATLALSHAPGTKFEYSNANYNLLGLIIQAASGQSYADYVQQQIFAPLQMQHTFTTAAMAVQHGLAMGHQYWFAIPVATPQMPIPAASLPAGMLSSTSEDLAHYLIALLNAGHYGDQRVISSASIGELQRGAADLQAFGRSLGQYAMGWFISEAGQSKLIWHSGTLPHFGAYMALLPERKRGLVLLCNTCHHWMTPVLAAFGAAVAGLLAGQPADPLPITRIFPLIMRGQLLIPALQLAGMAAPLRQLCRHRTGSQQHPTARTRLSMLLPLIPDLLLALSLLPLFSKRRGYLMLYMPDYAWTALILGGLSMLRSLLRIGLLPGRLSKFTVS